MEILPHDIIDEIFGKCMLIGGIKMSMINKNFHSKYSLKYNGFQSLLIYIISKIKDRQMLPFISVKEVFDKPIDFIKRFEHNKLVQKRIYPLNSKVQLVLSPFTKGHTKTSLKHLGNMSDREIIETIKHRKEDIVSIGLWRRIKHKYPNKDFSQVIKMIEKSVDQMNYHFLVAYMGHNIILQKDSKHIVFCRKLIRSNSDKYNILMGYAIGGHLDLFNKIRLSGWMESNDINYRMLISLICRGGCVEMLEIYKSHIHPNVNEHIRMAVKCNNQNILAYLLDLCIVKPISLCDITLLEYISVYDIIAKYIDKDIFVFMPINKLCKNKDRRSVDLLKQYGYIDDVELNDCLCGHKFEFYSLI
jgi:hypothetical protein